MPYCSGVTNKFIVKKSIVLLLFSVMTFGALHAQKKVKEVDTMKEEIEFNEFKSKYKNGVSIGTLEMSDGSTLSKGDVLQLGAPSQGMVDYQFIMLNKYSVMAAMAPVFMPGGYSNTMVKIEAIKGWRSMGKLIFSVDFRPVEGKFGGLQYGCTFSLERATSTGEIINPNKALTREQAIAKLKEAQDLMGLGMMSKEDFEALKAELTPIIMNQ